jgi:carboxyl-terminal processing protease
MEFADDRAVVKELFDDTLVRLGVAPGAEVKALDGKEIRDIEHRELIGYWLRREPFAYRVQFAGVAHAEEIEATSVPHRFRSMSWSWIRAIGYVRIDYFSNDTPIEFRRIARQFGQENIESLIIDVRGNPGGRRVIGFIDFFLKPSQDVASYSEIYEEGEPEDVKGTVEYYDHPLVVLVDGGSASMSELLAAAIQTNRRGTVVGETTSGKGVGQTIYPIGEEGELALVRTLYYYPGTRDSWNGVGIVPDLVIDPSEKEPGETHELPGTVGLDLERQLEWDRGLQEGVRILEATE